MLLASDARLMFPDGRNPRLALAGLFLRFSCLHEAHEIAQSAENADGSYWHAIMHRMEGDEFNSGYWFRRVGKHPIFPSLAAAARTFGYPSADQWDPYGFTRYCHETAEKKPGRDESLARRVQLAEWKLLFEYCAGSSAEAVG